MIFQNKFSKPVELPDRYTDEELRIMQPFTLSGILDGGLPFRIRDIALTDHSGNLKKRKGSN